MISVSRRDFLEISMSCRNSNIFNYADKVISFSEIDTKDDTCRLSLRTDPDSLLVSIKTLGIINPPVLRQRQDRKYQIVCGFRRIMACNALGLSEIKVRVLKESFNEVDSAAGGIRR